MTVSSTDFGQGNGHAFANFYTAPSIAFSTPQNPTTSGNRSAFISFFCQIDRELLGTEFHPATYATVFGNTSAPHTVNTVVCRYYGPNEPDVALRNRFVFYVTDAANNANGGPWAVEPGSGPGNVTFRVSSAPVTTDGPVLVVLELWYTFAAAPPTWTVRVQTGHLDANGTTVLQTGVSQIIPVANYSGITTTCPPWAIGAADTSGVLVSGNYWPGLLSQFVVATGREFQPVVMSRLMLYGWFGNIPEGISNLQRPYFARALGYGLANLKADPPRPWTDVVDNFFEGEFVGGAYVAPYPPLTYSGTFRDGGCLTWLIVNIVGIEAVRWATRPRVTTRASFATLSQDMWVVAAPVVATTNLNFLIGLQTYDPNTFNQLSQQSRQAVSGVIVTPQETPNSSQVLTKTFTYNVTGLPDGLVTASIDGVQSPNAAWVAAVDRVSRYTSRQFSQAVVNRPVFILDSHSKSGVTTLHARESVRESPRPPLVFRRGAARYLRIYEPRQMGMPQYSGSRWNREEVFVDLATQSTFDVTVSNVLASVAAELMSQNSTPLLWVHMHHRYDNTVDSSNVAATATAYLNALYGGVLFSGQNIVVMSAGRFGPQTANGLGLARPPEFYHNLHEAYKAWAVANNKLFSPFHHYAADWDPANVPYMRVLQNYANISRYVVDLRTALGGCYSFSTLIPDYVLQAARYIDATKRAFRIRLPGQLVGDNSQRFTSYTVTPPNASTSTPVGLEISLDGGTTWLRQMFDTQFTPPGDWGALVSADGTLAVGRYASLNNNWAALLPGQLRVRYGYGFPYLNFEPSTAGALAARYTEIMGASGALFVVRSDGVAVPVAPFEFIVGEPLEVSNPSAGGSRSLSSTGAGR